MIFAPPQHDPVVINLGEDSESDDSDKETPEAARADSKGTTAKGQLSGSLFGGLEMMIKEARKSVEVW